jgi:hypothetical protein
MGPMDSDVDAPIPNNLPDRLLRQLSRLCIALAVLALIGSFVPRAWVYPIGAGVARLRF